MAEDELVIGLTATPTVDPGDPLYGGFVVRAIPALDAVVLRGDGSTINALATVDPLVRYVEPNSDLAAAGYPNDPMFNDSRNGHHGIIRTPDAWNVTMGSTSVIIAAVDSGLDRAHEEFSGQARILAGRDIANSDNDPNDLCGHGTRMAGVMAATANNGVGAAGVAPGVAFLPVKVSDSCFAQPALIAEGIIYAVDHGAHMIHAPYTGGASSVVADAARYAHAAGVLLVVPSGNNRDPCTDCVSPLWASIPNETVIVSGTMPDDTPTPTHGHGPQVDIAAPSYGLFTTEPTWSELGSYSSNGGASSGASAVVAAVAALVKSAHPGLDGAAIVERLKSTAKDVGPTGRDDETGSGRVDAARAVQGASSTFDASFADVNGNAWWIEVAVTANQPLSRVDARVGTADWRPLSKKSWGDWAASYHAPEGSVVQLRATSTTGAQDLSPCYRWTAATSTTCPGTSPPAPPPPPPPPPSGVLFTHGGGNEWWVEAKVEPKPASVHAQDTGGAWTSLQFKSWGEWAGSFRIEPGHQVRFRATYSNGTTAESCWFTHPQGHSQCSSTPPPPPPPPPPQSSFDATFRNVRGNEWWIETDVAVTGGTLAGVDARVNGGAWTSLEKKEWGSWAKSLRAPSGSTIDFRARAADGSVDTTAGYHWPPT